MKSRERVIQALEHVEPDRVPIDLGGTWVSGIHAKAYYELRRYLGLPEKLPTIIDVGQQLADIDRDILELFHIDVIDVNRVLEPRAPYPRKYRFVGIDSSLKEVSEYEFWTWRTPYGIDVEMPKYVEVIEREDSFIGYAEGKPFGKMPKTGYYFWGLKHALADAKTIEDVKKFDWDVGKVSDDVIEVLKKKAEYLYKYTDYALVNPFMGSPVALGAFRGLHAGGQTLRGWDKWFGDLKFRKPLAEAILDHIFEVMFYNIKKIIDVIGGYIQVQVIGYDDMGVETGPQISVEVFREFYRDKYAEIISYVKKHSKAFTLLHSDGSIFPLIREFIDIGLDIINPVQISAKGMEPEKLKKTYGEQITFWGGGADNQHILPFAKPNELREHVKEIIRIFAPGGGYVFANIHNIQPGVPPENIVTMFKTAYEYGKYPIK
jgi:uroporphyrinogen decarboxylase